MSQRTQRLFEAVYLIALVALIALPVTRVVLWFFEAMPFPYAIDYNEGIVWKQMVEIVAGRGYAPIDGFPAIVFHYPPVYHVTMAAVAATGLDPMVSGRAVSLAATLGSALLIGDLARRQMPSGRPVFTVVAMMAAMVLFLLFEAVHFWAPQIRVDPLACFFALAGLWCVAQSDARAALAYLAAVLFVLSVFTKQVSIVAPAASFGALLILRPGRGVRAIAATVVLGAIVLAGLTWQTGGGVLRHLFLYNINRFEMARLLPNLIDGTSRSDQVLLVFCLIGYLVFLVAALRHHRAGGETSVGALATLLFVPIATLSLVATGKFGSSSAYYIQWQAGLAIYGGLAIGSLVKAASAQLASGSPARAAGWAAIPLAVTLVFLHYPDPWHHAELQKLSDMDRQIVPLLAPVHGDVISDEMVILMRMHRDVVWEPAIFAELARKGVWNEQLVIDQFRRHRIGAVVSDGDRGNKWFDERYNPAVVAAMDAALPRKIAIGDRVVHLPALPPAADVTETPNSAAAQRLAAASASGSAPAPPSSAPAKRR